MSNENTHQRPTPDAELHKLDRLVGAWKIEDEAEGQITFEWLRGGFFLKQVVDITQDGERHTGVEIIGREKPMFQELPSEDIKSRFYDDSGNTLDYVYEMEDDTLTIWGGEKGSPAYFRGTFSEDGNTLDGSWVWPGGGYHTVATRIS